MSRLKKKIFVGIITFIAIAIAIIFNQFWGAYSTTNNPNIILIVADDLGWNDVGYNGSEIKTPNLNKLAESSVRLEKFYVKNKCTPTRAALMTGKHPFRFGMSTNVIWPWDKVGLPLQEKTIAQTLKEAGYYTAILGKWHLGHYKEEYLPTRRGFDYHYGHYCGGLDYFTRQVAQGGLDWHRNEKALQEEGYTTDLIGREAVKLIGTRNFNESPLFLYIAFNAPHTPLQAKEEVIKNYKDLQDEGRRVFAAQVHSMDEAVGNIVKALKQKKVWKNTVLFFTSDNGGATYRIQDKDFNKFEGLLRGDNRPLKGQKGTLYEGGVRVPTIISYPAKLKGGQISDQTFSVVDLYPTLAKLAKVNLDSQNQLNGVDILEALAAGYTPRDEMLIQYINNSTAAVIKKNYKLILNGMGNIAVPYYGTVELFDLKNDPWETHNLAYSEPERVKEIQEIIEKYAKESVPPILNGSGGKPQDFIVPKVWSPDYL
jgi:arylsulfatase A-like enzyme